MDGCIFGFGAETANSANLFTSIFPASNFPSQRASEKIYLGRTECQREAVFRHRVVTVSFIRLQTTDKQYVATY
jgi:hypothetical protein